MRHSGEIETANEMIDPERIDKVANLPDTGVGRTNDKSIRADNAQLVDGICIFLRNQRMFPATAIFISIIDQQMLFGYLDSLLIGFRNDHFAGKCVGTE